jgi:hypothetical protein
MASLSFNDWNTVASTFGSGVAQALQNQNVPLSQVSSYITKIAPTLFQGGNNANDPSNLAALINAQGGGQGGQGSGQGGQSNPFNNSIIGNPMYSLSQLGAAALKQPMIVNPNPAQQPINPQGGVFSGAQTPMVSSTVPKPPAGPWMNTPGLFGAPGPMVPGGPGIPPTGTPPIQPIPPYGGLTGASGPGRPFATPPAAPNVQYPTAGIQQGVQQQIQAGMPPGAPGFSPADFLSAHTSALADAGKAIYAHYGGDPSSATPADIAGFHSQLQSAIAGGPPIKMRSGGLVPSPIGMDSGGYVTDDNPDDDPPEARRRALRYSGGNGPTTSPGPAGQSYAAASGGGASVQTDPNAAGYAPRAQFAGAPSDYGSAPRAELVGLPAGQGAAYDPKTYGINTGPSASQVSSAIGGLASGLTAAAQQYANSVKPWQVQASHIPEPPPAKEVTLNQPQAEQGGQQEDPHDLYYRLRMMGLLA